MALAQSSFGGGTLLHSPKLEQSTFSGVFMQPFNPLTHNPQTMWITQSTNDVDLVTVFHVFRCLIQTFFRLADRSLVLQSTLAVCFNDYV